MLKKFLLILLIVSFFLPSPSWAGSTSSGVPSQTFLANLKQNQIFLVESFSKIGKNRLGHTSEIKLSEKIRFWENYQEDDAIYENGRSLKLSFWLIGKNKISWETALAPLDMSQARYLSFWFRGSIGAKSHIKVFLEDELGKSHSVPIFPYVGTENRNGWRPVVLPLYLFENLDFNQLQSLKLEVSSGFMGLVGQAQFDHIAFVGPKEVFFQSIQDNLKGYPSSLSVLQRRKELLQMEDRKMLLEIAKDTWKYFDNFIDKRTNLIIDHAKLDADRFVGDYTSPTNVGLYHISCVAAYHLGFISRKDAVERIKKSLKALQQLETYEGFFYNFYNTSHLHPTNFFISSIDNAWLASSYVIIRSAFKKELGRAASKMLDDMDFDFFYDPGVGQMSVGYDVEKKEYSPFHYSLLATETRMLSMLSIGKGDAPRDHWFHLYRIPPVKWDWQTQKGKEEDRTVEGEDMRTGFYKYHQRRFIPSWGGSMFEFLMPTILVPEKDWSPFALGINNKIASEIQRDYALKERHYPVWGISPCAVSRGKKSIYAEFGVKALGIKGYNDAGIITPHATFLTLETIPEDAIKNLRRMLKLYDVYGEYGFYDSLQIRGKRITRQYLALDQGMSFIALTNYLNNGSIHQIFGSDPIGKNIKELLQHEEFF